MEEIINGKLGDNQKASQKLERINWKSLLLELLVVFVGVYGAFLLDSYRSGQVDKKNKITYFKAFELILDKYLQSSQSLKKEINNQLVIIP